MSTNILNGRVTVTRFSGGTERGTCYQITEGTPQISAGTGYASMTRDEAIQVAGAILRDVRDEH